MISTLLHFFIYSSVWNFSAKLKKFTKLDHLKHGFISGNNQLERQITKVNVLYN